MDTKITIYDRDKAEEAHLEAALRAAMRQSRVHEVEIFVAPREPSGWLEYGVRVRYLPGGALFIGVLQREPGAAIECHT